MLQLNLVVGLMNDTLMVLFGVLKSEVLPIVGLRKRFTRYSFGDANVFAEVGNGIRSNQRYRMIISILNFRI